MSHAQNALNYEKKVRENSGGATEPTCEDGSGRNKIDLKLNISGYRIINSITIHQ